MTDVRQVDVQLHDGRPTVLGDRGTRYQVTDVPTALDELFNGPTHVPFIDGWRFQGTNIDGETFVFDVVRRGSTWLLVHVYS